MKESFNPETLGKIAKNHAQQEANYLRDREKVSADIGMTLEYQKATQDHLNELRQEFVENEAHFSPEERNRKQRDITKLENTAREREEDIQGMRELREAMDFHKAPRAQGGKEGLLVPQAEIRVSIPQTQSPKRNPMGEA